MAELFPSRSHNAYNRYTQDLSNALYNRDWIYDPSYALASDAEIYAKIMRDPVAAHAIRFRQHLVAGVEWTIEPFSDAPADKQAAAIVKNVIDRISGFTDARIRLGGAIMKGSSYSFIAGRRKFMTVAGGSPQSWWIPTKLDDVDRRRFRLASRRDLDPGGLQWEIWSPVRREWDRVDHPEWFVRSVFDDCEDSLGYGRGLLDTLYYYQAAKARVLQSALSASERFGEGFLMAKIKGIRDPSGKPRRVAGGSNQTIADAWATQLKKHRARNILVMDAEDEVTMLTGNDQGWKLLQSMLSYTDIAQVTAVLGSSLSTMQSMNEVGSNAKAKTHEDSTETLVQADRERLGDDLTRDLVGAIWRYNQFAIRAQAGESANMPRFSLIQQKREDPVEAANIISTLLGSGVDLKSEEVYAKTGFSVPQDGDAIIEGTAGGAAGGLMLPPGFSQRLAGLSSSPVGILSRRDEDELRGIFHQAGFGDSYVRQPRDMALNGRAA